MNIFEKDHLKIAQTQHAQDPIPSNTTKELSKDKKIKSNRLLEAYCTMSIPRSTIDDKKSRAAEFTMDTVEQLLNYCATHRNANMIYKKSDIIPNILAD